MNNQSSGSENSQRLDPLAPTPTLSADALARRRLLLKGAGGGATALAALTPVGALATSQSTVYTCIGQAGKEGLCTLSGVQSAAHSFGPNIVKVPAGGLSPGWWGQEKYVSGNIVPKRTWPVPYGNLVQTVLTLAPSNLGGLTLFELMRNPSYSNKVERHWLCAYLNAKASEQGLLPAPYQFPYTSTDVVNFYLASDQNAYQFFTTYMEKL